MLVTIVAISFLLRAAQIENSMPYPRQVDEPAVLEPAARIVTTGSYHPTYFTYPSLPIYLAAAGLGLGVVRAAASLEARTVDEIGRVSYPYYSAPTVAKTARQLFAMLSVLALVGVGVATLHYVGERSGLILAPLILALSPYFFEMSWRYVNVDISAACFATLCLAATLAGTRHPSMRWSAVIPGLCAGLAAGSKYIHGLLLLTVLLGIWLFVARGRRGDAMLVATLACGVTFVATSPYVVLDVPTFIDGLAFNARHYAFGHAGHESAPGFAKLGYYGGQLLKDFGPVALIVAGVAIAGAARSDWRRTLVLPVLPVLATRIACRLSAWSSYATSCLSSLGSPWPLPPDCCRFAMALRAESRPNGFPRRGCSPAGTVVLALLFLVTVGWGLARLPAQFHVPPESRTDIVAWIGEHVSVEHTLLVPEELGLDARPLEALGYNVVAEPFLGPGPTERREVGELVDAMPHPFVVLVPTWGIDQRFPGAESRRHPQPDCSRTWFR